MNQQTPIVLLTRPKAQSESLAALLRDRWGSGVEVVVSELLQIVMAAGYAQIPQETALIFTSARGVEAFDLHQRARGHVAYCVGAATQAAAARAGCNAHSADGDVAALTQMILTARPQPNPRVPMVYLCGQHVTGGLDETLTAQGLSVDKRVVYDQLAMRLNGAAKRLLQTPQRVIVPVFSPRSATVLSSQVRKISASLDLIFISQAAQKAWQGASARQMVVARPSGDVMLQAIHDAVAAGGWVEGRETKG